MISEDVDAELRRLAEDRDFQHRDAARHGIRFRAGGDVADLVAIQDDPHPCGMNDVIFALASAERPWLNWVPMPTEAVCNLADQLGARRSRGEDVVLTAATLTAAEPASALTACRRVLGPLDVEIGDFPPPDLRQPLWAGRYVVWSYDGAQPVPAVPPPSAAAIQLLHQVGAEPWASPLAGYAQAAPLGTVALDDLLGLLAHLPGPPDTPRWRHLATSTPTYWYRLMQPWVCLAMLHHLHGPWATSTVRQVLVDLAFGVEDWVADSALFALVTAAYREPELRAEVRGLVRARLDAAVAADRLVTIEESLAHLMLVTPGCQDDDRDVASRALAAQASDSSDEEPVRTKPRWWRRRG